MLRGLGPRGFLGGRGGALTPTDARSREGGIRAVGRGWGDRRRPWGPHQVSLEWAAGPLQTPQWGPHEPWGRACRMHSSGWTGTT